MVTHKSGSLDETRRLCMGSRHIKFDVDQSSDYPIPIVFAVFDYILQTKPLSDFTQRQLRTKPRYP